MWFWRTCVCVCVLHEIVSLFSLQRVLLIHFNEHSVSHMCFSFQISMWFCCCFYFFHFPTYIHTHTRLTHSMSSEMWKDSTISVFVAGGVWWYKEWIRRRHVAIRCGIHNLNLQNFCFAAYLFAGSFAALFLCVMLPTQYNHHFSAVSFLIYCLILIIMTQFLVSLASISLLIQIIFPLVMYEWLLSKTFAYLSSLAWLFMSFL